MGVAAAIESAHINAAVLKMWDRYTEVCDDIPVAQVPEAAKLFSEFTPVDGVRRTLPAKAKPETKPERPETRASSSTSRRPAEGPQHKSKTRSRPRAKKGGGSGRPARGWPPSPGAQTRRPLPGSRGEVKDAELAPPRLVRPLPSAVAGEGGVRSGPW